MFTGLVQAVGKVRFRDDSQLEVSTPASFAPEGFDAGESIAVNGVCLTVVATEGGILFDISEETWRRTALGRLEVGQFVNLERAMLPTTRFGGHVVQGHVDTVSTLVSAEEERFVWRLDAAYDRYLIDKGSIALDGISLTVVSPEVTDRGAEFETWIIPHTKAHTNLQDRRPGDPVNVEFDVLAKYVEKMIANRDR